MYYYCTLLHFLPFSQCCTVQARQQILQPTLTSKMDVARSNDNKYPSDWKATGSGLHTLASSTHMSLRIERPEKKGQQRTFELVDLVQYSGAGAR